MCSLGAVTSQGSWAELLTPPPGRWFCPCCRGCTVIASSWPASTCKGGVVIEAGHVHFRTVRARESATAAVVLDLGLLHGCHAPGQTPMMTSPIRQAATRGSRYAHRRKLLRQLVSRIVPGRFPAHRRAPVHRRAGKGRPEGVLRERGLVVRPLHGLEGGQVVGRLRGERNPAERSAVDERSPPLPGDANAHRSQTSHPVPTNTAGGPLRSASA